MKQAVVIVAGMAVLTASLAAQADQKKEDEKFCAAAAAVQSDVAELKALGPHSTVAEAQAASGRVENDVAQMQQAAGHMKTPAAKQFVDATNTLTKYIRNIPDDATLQQVRPTIQADVQNAQTSGRQVAKEAGCPQMAPQQEPMPKQQPY
jgi:hypothetical protein